MVSHKTNQDSKQKAQQEQQEQQEKQEKRWRQQKYGTQQKIVTMVQKMVHNPRVLTWLFKTMPAVKKIKS